VGGVISLILPRPLSANRYWASRVVQVKGKPMPVVYVTKEAKDYRKTVAAIAAGCGIVQPLPGRVAIEIDLYPHRPLDFKARQRKLGPVWDDSVQSIDLDNANKVLLDSLKGIAFEDDAWVRRLVSQRMEPDDEGERVVVRIEQMQVVQPQLALLGEAA
jgi:crossover junction endodeoxyribonuclease RusA